MKVKYVGRFREVVEGLEKPAGALAVDLPEELEALAEC